MILPRLSLANLWGLALLGLGIVIHCGLHLLHTTCLILTRDITSSITQLLSEFLQFFAGFFPACLIPHFVRKFAKLRPGFDLATLFHFVVGLQNMLSDCALAIFLFSGFFDIA